MLESLCTNERFSIRDRVKTNDVGWIEMNATNYTIVWFKLSEFIVLSRVNAMQCHVSRFALCVRSLCISLCSRLRAFSDSIPGAHRGLTRVCVNAQVTNVRVSLH